MVSKVDVRCVSVSMEGLCPSANQFLDKVINAADTPTSQAK
jgi:hypothetical protein